MGNKAVKLPSYSFAKQRGATILQQAADGQITLAVSKQASPAAIAELQRLSDVPVALNFYDAKEYQQVIQKIYHHQQSMTDNVVADLDNSEAELSQVAEALSEPEDLLESNDDAPIIRLINALLADAVKVNASDIHIEPGEDHLSIRYRVDGELQEVLTPDRSLTQLIASRVKIMSKLDIAEKRLPQDGRISLKIAGHPIDVRVSTIPGAFGERIVMRLLDKKAGQLSLKQLGMNQRHLMMMQELVKLPHGIILVTGPTGSGKTTSLYAAIEAINERSRNIMTIEDPIEYHLQGISQTQVNSKVDMSFARGLRAILRQDPDVIMIGEIRDLETAEIAIQASLTGHLVFSTLHTNTAIGAITRLIDMGVPPFLLASSVKAVIAQRLVKRLNPETRLEQPVDEAMRQALQLPDDVTSVYQADESLPVNQAYAGRMGVFEVITMDQQLKTMIHQNQAENDMAAYAHKTNPGIAADAKEKLIAGATSIDEILRVIHSG
ncbi:type II secretion system ATPase GspE [Marinicella sp. S1101]|uniref:type II secretion system ATPase GspE n=1 Tax=Marinicella marina TaxID=2996016 RepID=UPI002260D641|nr:type II secretion system ATPase GspE [Marinicella marina]MCX7553907.1 type II secretion system ATPase GspE [Marinicella marina]MDJ1140399.1 type II secretion system ATPase GspE [Marinicella marina]